MTRVLMGLCLTVLSLVAGGLPAEAQSYRIQRGDVLQVEVVEDSSLNRNLLVLPDGNVTLPLAGSVQAAGRTLSQVQEALESKLMPNFASRPTVFLSITQLAERASAGSVDPATVDVFILGEAANSGKLSVEPGTTLLQVFSQMGGFTPFAATKRIQLRRTDPRTGVEQIYKLNYEAIQSGRSKNGLVAVADGDVILVPQRSLFE